MEKYTLAAGFGISAICLAPYLSVIQIYSKRSSFLQMWTGEQLQLRRDWTFTWHSYFEHTNHLLTASLGWRHLKYVYPWRCKGFEAYTVP